MEELNLKIIYKVVGYLCAPEIWGPDKRTYTIHMLRGTLITDFIHVH